MSFAIDKNQEKVGEKLLESMRNCEGDVFVVAFTKNKINVFDQKDFNSSNIILSEK
ncbi:MAG: hypothetical protein ACOCQR_01900 [bacterium]